jgi:hypothetical protein
MVIACCVLVTAASLCFVGPAPAAEGHFNILTDAHGYSTGGRTLVPLRAIAEWLGADVAFKAPHISITLGSTVVRLAVNSSSATVAGRSVRLSVPARVYGGITCVPLRFVAEAFGLQVSYHAGDDPEMDKTSSIPLVLLEGRGMTGRVLVHEEPPNVVSKVIRDLENTTQGVGNGPDAYAFQLGDYGFDWILQVTKIHSGYFMSLVPAQWGEPYFDTPGLTETFSADAAGVYGYRGGRWVYVAGFQDVPSYNYWVRELGIPASVAQQLGIQLQHY